MRNRPIYDVVALLARCGVGMVFVAHGWQKIQVGINATGRNLDAMGAPAPTAAAVYSTFVELLCGAALILGVALPVAGTLLFLDMAGALVFVQGKHGIFLVDNGKVHNGYELVLVLGLAALVFATGGAGRLTLDHWLFRRSGARHGAGRAGGTAGELGWGAPLPDETRPLPAPAKSGDAPRRRAKLGFSRRRAVPAAAAGADSTPPAGAFPTNPDADEASSSTRPRLAAEMVTDTSRDVIVAGRKKTDPSSDDTTPVRTRKKQSRSDSGS